MRMGLFPRRALRYRMFISSIVTTFTVKLSAPLVSTQHAETKSPHVDTEVERDANICVTLRVLVKYELEK